MLIVSRNGASQIDGRIRHTVNATSFEIDMILVTEIVIDDTEAGHHEIAGIVEAVGEMKGTKEAVGIERGGMMSERRDLEEQEKLIVVLNIETKGEIRALGDTVPANEKEKPEKTLEV